MYDWDDAKGPPKWLFTGMVCGIVFAPLMKNDQPHSITTYHI